MARQEIDAAPVSKDRSWILVREWECQECGRKMNIMQAQQAVCGSGCPGCGGSDIDLTVSLDRR